MLAQQYNVRPYWLVAAAEEQFRGRYLIGTKQENIDKFNKNMSITLLYADSEPKIKGQSIIDIDKKEITNLDDEDEDEYIVSSLRGESATKIKDYELDLGKNVKFGGDIGFGITSSFFNAGINLTGEKSRHKGDNIKKGAAETLSEEYGMKEKIVVPPHTKLNLEIITYAVSYELEIRVKVAVPKNSSLQVALRTRGCCTNEENCLYLRSKHILKQLDPSLPINEDEELYYFESAAKVKYIGEKTKINKTITETRTLI